MATPKHILVSRTDKIGDLLCSLPVFQTLREAFPQARLTALVRPYTRELVQGHPAVDDVELLEEGESALQLAARFKKLEADAFIALYPRPSIAFAAAWAGIPVRIGTAYRWYSFLFNQKIKVHRSVCDRHEVEYNLDLVAPLGASKLSKKINLPLSDNDRSFARDLLKEKGVPSNGRYVVVHPGHRGSALNWKPERYAEVAGRLIQSGNQVVLTAGAEETEVIAQLKVHLDAMKVDQKPIMIMGESTLKQLAAVYERADCFLSGSTGTMHLAAAVGTPTVALFCPIPQTTPVRWGPWGNEATVLLPEGLECPRCRKGVCSQHDPMDAISTDKVYQAVMKFVEKAGRK